MGEFIVTFKMQQMVLFDAILRPTRTARVLGVNSGTRIAFELSCISDL